jgi:membrane protein
MPHPSGQTLGPGANLLDRARRFFEESIWSLPRAELRRGKALLYRTCRIGYAALRGFRDKQLTQRAAALTYYCVLSVVPFLAFAFSVVKGFGAYKRLVEGTLRPYLHSTFGGNPTLSRAIDQVLTFVEATDVSRLSAVGLLLLVYSGISLLATIESALNDIWGASRPRPLMRRVTEYTTLLVITPLLMLVAVTLGTAAQSSGVMLWAREHLALDVVMNVLLRLTSLALACVALIALFLILPNTRVRISSAVLGGVVGGLLWQGTLVLHVKLQVGVASYNALYSGFGALPIFLVWLDASWLVVLLGAQIAATHQHERALAQEVRARHVDEAFRETLAAAIAADVTRRFLDGGPPPTPAGLATALEAPPPTVEQVAEALVKGGVLARAAGAASDRDFGYLPARDVDRLTLLDVREAVRANPAAAPLRAALNQKVGRRLERALAGAEGPCRDAEAALTLRAMAGLYAADELADAQAAPDELQLEPPTR